MEEELINEGKVLPLCEEFYSIQGEGYHTGKAAYFIRLGGCDTECSWCDTKVSWDSEKYPLISTDKLVENIITCPSKAVVVTGGEPLLYNLNYLCNELVEHNIETFLETSGTNEITGEWDWICLSPKKDSPPLPDIYKYANELKVIISEKEDIIWAEENAKKVNKDCYLYLQPEWSKKEVVLPIIIDYILNHPEWRISNQVHKFIGIP
jgi:7-carboxy-7-deazaguanine synthase